MANTFDPRGAAIAVGIILLVGLIALAVTLPMGAVSIKLDLPPAKAPAR